MADVHTTARSALYGVVEAGRIGPSEGEPGVLLHERTDLSIMQVLARKGQADALRTSLQTLGYELPAGPGRTDGHGVALIWTGPDQWLALGPARNAVQIRNLFAPLATLSSSVQAEDSRTILSVGGPKARDALAKLVSLDLHPRAFKPGDAAVTVAGGIPAALWQVDATPTYEIAVPRSFARSFWHWLTEASAEYGCLVQGEPG